MDSDVEMVRTSLMKGTGKAQVGMEEGDVKIYDAYKTTNDMLDTVVKYNLIGRVVIRCDICVYKK